MATEDSRPERDAAFRADDRFVWPPTPEATRVEVLAPKPPALETRTTHPSPPPSPVRVPAPTRLRRVTTALREMGLETESVLLGVTAATWPVRARLAGWQPDDPALVCPRCASDVGPHEADADGCPACRTRQPAWARAVRLGRYEGVLAEALRDVKFTAWRRLGDDLGRAMGLVLAQRLREAGITPREAVLVPTPTTTRRRLRTGIDHTLVLARGVRATSGVRIAQALRRRHGPRQIDVAPSARGRNVAKVFTHHAHAPTRLGLEPSKAGVLWTWSPRWIRPAGPAPPRVIVVLDDIRTTGATLNACARAIAESVRRAERATETREQEPHPRPEIWIASLAVTPPRDRHRPPTLIPDEPTP